MKKDNIVFHISTGENNNSFVGLKIKGNQIHFYYPESYHFDQDDFERDDILDLLKTISIAKTKSSVETGVADERLKTSDMAMYSYLWIIEDYLRNGNYRNIKKRTLINQRGKVNWKRTIQQFPLISGQNVVYNNLFVDVLTPINGVIIEAYKYCVKKSLCLLGWLYELSPDVIEVEETAEKMVPYYLDAIRKEIENTFDDEKHTRLTHMENVLRGLDEISEETNIVYGVDKYDYVFEMMIDAIFGTEDVTNYYPHYEWSLCYAPDGGKKPVRTIREDTIMKDDENIYIIDSKFYRFGSLNLAKAIGLPDASSIVKQITYGLYISETHPGKDVFNAFILPYDMLSDNGKLINDEDKTLVYVGSVSSEWALGKTYSTVHTFLIDFKYVVKNWNKKNPDKEKAKVVSEIKRYGQPNPDGGEDEEELVKADQ